MALWGLPLTQWKQKVEQMCVTQVYGPNLVVFSEQALVPGCGNTTDIYHIGLALRCCLSHRLFYLHFFFITNAIKCRPTILFKSSVLPTVNRLARLQNSLLEGKAMAVHIKGCRYYIVNIFIPSVMGSHIISNASRLIFITVTEEVALMKGTNWPKAYLTDKICTKF